ncbi:DUF2262 domain-containing protein [Maribacter sp.]|uniref:DUF2262 domain-containing protein n=1 Tax=Maribacter sp. TaxID=1897614 RepID=UPI0025BBACC0|nr:DUF2262 domain-containing protein [Maribacter sp.]
MGIFNIKKRGYFKLSKADFKTKKDDFELVSVKFSGNFFEKLSQETEKENSTEELAQITNTASIILFKNKVEIVYNPSEIELEEDKFITLINQKLNWINNNKSLINIEITKKLLPLKNENWLEENETKISEIEFVKRIRLASILFLEDGSSELIFNDGNLFWEHQIVADLSAKNKLIAINIRG